MTARLDSRGGLGDSLIFLISQPRSGSTLLQHLIASHPQVHTTAEPWLLLPLVYGLKPTGIQADYDAQIAFNALAEFLKLLPGGEEAYVQEMGRMALALYDRALYGTGKAYFLDKTPRYYLIIPELAKMFPSARFILLIRNPLAVLASILRQHGGNWAVFRERARMLDVCQAPRLLLSGSQILGDRATVVAYESLVGDPEQETRRICDRIGLEFYPGMLRYGDKTHLEGAFVDQKSIYRHSRAVPDYVEQWRRAFDNPQARRFARGYLQSLGPSVVGELGYSFVELAQVLGMPTRFEDLYLASWQQLTAEASQMRWWERLRAALVLPLSGRGIRALVKRCGQAVVGCSEPELNASVVRDGFP